MAAMRARQPVVRTQRGADADGHRLLADRHVDGPRKFALEGRRRQSLLDAPDQKHLVIPVLKNARGEVTAVGAVDTRRGSGGGAQ